jgi:hypothetical protein
MNQIIEWLEIGKPVEEQEPVVEPISNKKFIFMTVIGIGLIVGMKLLLH